MQPIDMNEIDARNALLIRAFETAPATPQWDEDDREWASRTAAGIEGENASAEAFVSRRAGLAAERLAGRVPAVAHALAAVEWRPAAGWLVVAAAFLAGMLLDAVSADQRINILAPPILAILVWNLAVYLLLVFRALLGARPPPAQDSAAHPGLMQRLIARLMLGVPRSLLKADADAPLVVFVRQWLQAASSLNTSRALSVLHYAAAAFAFGALAGLYTRGLAFEYLAGWESTFLKVEHVHGLLQFVLGPAAFMTGIPLPDAARLAAIRLPSGTGENAASWIHLYAVTVLLVVGLPRVALGGWEALLARRKAVRLQVPLTDGYFQNLQRRHSGDAAHVRVVPYSYRLSTEGTRGLKRLMQMVYGDETEVAVSPPVTLGGEDRLLAPASASAAPASTSTPAPGAALTVALFSLAATPEAENHAAFLAALAGTLPAEATIVALVDESSFIRRFGAASGRLADRRATWRRILASRVDIEPVFVSLEAEDLGEARSRLGELLDELSARLVQNARFRAGAKASA